MKAIFLKEVHQFFSSLIGFLAMGIFIAITGFLLWFFPDYSVMQYGYATLEMFFSLAPVLLLIIVPAITMRLFSEEKQTGTIEWLFTKPIKDLDIILGKYFASVFLIFVTLLPTVIYYISLYLLGSPVGNIDTGGVIGSYIGLFLLASTFCAIGLYCSALTSNQIMAFILSALGCAFFFWGFDLLSNFSSLEGMPEYIIRNLGVNYHYESLSKGLIDTRDIVYFLCAIVFFNFLTLMELEKRKY
jgi:ABC-2 type transport system permease protein